MSSVAVAFLVRKFDVIERSLSTVRARVDMIAAGFLEGHPHATQMTDTLVPTIDFLQRDFQ
jgi:hypothetical protein